MSTHSLRTRREPSLLGEFTAALLHRVLTALIEWRNRRTQRATSARPEFGVDEQYVPELHGIGVQVVEDREFGLYGGDLYADARLVTQEFTVEDRLDADRTYPATHELASAAWSDATEVALRAGVR